MNSAAIVVGAVDNYIAVSHDSATTVKPSVISLSGAYMRLNESASNIQSESGRFFSDNPINLAVREKSLVFIGDELSPAVSIGIPNQIQNSIEVT
jgi:hypothetical protein